MQTNRIDISDRIKSVLYLLWSVDFHANIFVICKMPSKNPETKDEAFSFNVTEIFKSAEVIALNK